MKRLLPAIIGLCLTTISCNEVKREPAALEALDYLIISEDPANETSKKDFPMEITLDSLECVPLDFITTNREIDILYKNGYIIIKSLEKVSGEKLVSVVNAADNTLTAQLATVGTGPDEFTDIRLLPSYEEDALCYIMSLSNYKLYRLTDSMTLDFVTTLPEPKNVKNFRPRLDKPEMIDSMTLIIGQSGKEGYGLCSYNLHDSTIKGLLAFDFTRDLDSWYLVYDGPLIYNQKQNKIAYAFSWYDRFLIYDLTNDSITSCQSGKIEPMNVKTRTEFFETGENNLYYNSGFSNDDYIFLIYLGDKVYAHDRNETRHHYLEQYTWDGEPVCRYRLPAGMVYQNGSAGANPDEIYIVNKSQDDFLYKIKLHDHTSTDSKPELI